MRGAGRAGPGGRRPGTARADRDAPSPLIARGSLVAAEWRPEEGFVELTSPAVSVRGTSAAGGSPFLCLLSCFVTLGLLSHRGNSGRPWATPRKDGSGFTPKRPCICWSV